MSIRLHLTSVFVDDQDEALRFYTEVLGFEPRTDVPLGSVHREVERAESAGITVSRRVGNTRLVRANTDSPYYDGLSDLLIKAFGPPTVLAEALEDVEGVESAYVYGSWAARLHGVAGRRPVGDIDVLVLGEPDRAKLYAALSGVEDRLGRPANVTIRDADWLSSGSSTFHATVTQRPLVAAGRSSASMEPMLAPISGACAKPRANQSENARMASCQLSQTKTASTSAPCISACWTILRPEVPESMEYDIESIMLHESYFEIARPWSGERDEQHTAADRACGRRSLHR